MINTIFSGIFDVSTTTTVSLGSFALCILTSLFIGVIISMAYTYKAQYTKSFVVTLAMLPAVVCMVIMMVNGNVGTGVAVAGAFSLVRFRSVPGTAKEIGTIFLAMGAGLVAGMGYLGYAVLFSVVMSCIFVLLNTADFGMNSDVECVKTLRITIPEDLDYAELFDDLFAKYTKQAKVVSVKTTNMGSLFKLSYDVVMKRNANEKKFIDDLRCRNGNLEISMSLKEANINEL